MPEQKNNGLRFIFVGFVVAFFVTVLMCGVTIRQEIIRLASPQRKAVNTAGAARPIPAATRRYPTPAEAAQQPPVPTPEAPRLFNAADPTYLRFRTLQGHWKAEGMDEKGVWIFAVELRENPVSPGQFYGFTTFSNVPLGPPAGGLGRTKQELLSTIRPLLPKSMILEGVADHASISFHLQKPVGVSDCPFTKLVLTQFGNTDLMAEWQFGECRSGEGLMMRGMQ